LPVSEPDLKALMERSLDGDASAYRRLLEGLRERLSVYFGRRLAADPSAAEDLVQETLMAIHAKRATFDRQQLVTAWAYAIARYKLVDHFRRAGRGRFVALDADAGFAAPDEAEAAEARHDVGRGLAELPKRARELVVAVKLREEPVADVARRTGMSESAVKVAVHRGFRRLADHLRRGRTPDRDAGDGSERGS
jgi:RNA polymerase sigma-70 factor (ECF subfamily)